MRLSNQRKAGNSHEGTLLTGDGKRLLFATEHREKERKLPPKDRKVAALPRISRCDPLCLFHRHLDRLLLLHLRNHLCAGVTKLGVPILILHDSADNHLPFAHRISHPNQRLPLIDFQIFNLSVTGGDNISRAVLRIKPFGNSDPLPHLDLRGAPHQIDRNPGQTVIEQEHLTLHQAAVDFTGGHPRPKPEGRELGCDIARFNFIAPPDINDPDACGKKDQEQHRAGTARHQAPAVPVPVLPKRKPPALPHPDFRPGGARHRAEPAVLPRIGMGNQPVFPAGDAPYRQAAADAKVDQTFRKSAGDQKSYCSSQPTEPCQQKHPITLRSQIQLTQYFLSQRHSHAPCR